ncbi:tachylectin-related carbohydrate-binding protein [Nostoc sp.]
MRRRTFLIALASTTALCSTSVFVLAQDSIQILFTLRPNGQLSYYTYIGLPNLNNFANAGSETLISGGWNEYQRVFSGGAGILFALRPNGQLSYYRYIGLPNLNNFANAGSETLISGGWNEYKDVFHRQAE